jgi:hypothetical protein
VVVGVVPVVGVMRVVSVVAAATQPFLKVYLEAGVSRVDRMIHADEHQR